MPWSSKRGTPADARRRAEYDRPEYRRKRAEFGRLVASGNAFCWRCGGWINPDLRDAAGRAAWHTGHDRGVIRGPEHNTCNLSAGGRDGNRAARRARRLRL
jgi:hypothetical protein